MPRSKWPPHRGSKAPVSNKANKQDKLASPGPHSAPWPASGRRSRAGVPNDTVAAPGLCLDRPADIGIPKLNEPAAAPEMRSAVAPPKPKVVAKPPPQKTYALLSDAQIAGIKERLKLSSSQESYWPAVETALRGIARKIHASAQDRSRRA